jgi:hypothetical protein
MNDGAPTLRPWHRRRYRFGIKIGLDKIRFPGAQSCVSWAAIQLQSGVAAEGESTKDAKSLVGEIMSQYGSEAFEGVTLYRYTVDTFPRSAAAAGGMTLQQHGNLIDRTVEQLRAAGIDVQIEIVTDWGFQSGAEANPLED